MSGIDQRPMIKKPNDQPFRSREEIEMEQALANRYRELGNVELLAAIATDYHDSDQPAH